MEGRRKLLDAAMDVLIVLAIIASMVEDAADAAGASMRLRQALGFASFAFDVLFTLEFAARFADAAFEGRRDVYLARELGWVDCLASLPLLVLVSGPFAIAALARTLSAGSRGAIAATRALGMLRALRSLRLIRAMRIVSSIRGYDSVATRRHVAAAASLGMGAVIVSFLLVEAAATAGLFPVSDDPTALGLASLGATLAALSVVAATVLLYGPFFARGVGAPVLASIRWASGEDTRVRVLPPLGRSDEEPFLLAELLDEKARRESDPAPLPASRQEIEGLLSRAQSYADPDIAPPDYGEPRGYGERG